MGEGRLAVRISRYTGCVKVLLSLEERLVRRIDRASRRLGLSRSAYVARLAERELGAGKGPGGGRAARAALRRLDGLFGANPHGKPAEAVRAERDAR
jgi:hypothetical protein